MEGRSERQREGREVDKSTAVSSQFDPHGLHFDGIFI